MLVFTLQEHLTLVVSFSEERNSEHVVDGRSRRHFQGPWGCLALVLTAIAVQGSGGCPGEDPCVA